MSNEKRSFRFLPAIIFAVCLFAGVAAGKAFDNISAGTFIGLGSGLIISALLRLITFRKKVSPKNDVPEEEKT